MGTLRNAPTSVANWLEYPGVRRGFSSHFPKTSQFTREIRRGHGRIPVISPSRWTKDGQRWSLVGTAYDYLVGLLHRRDALERPFKRVRSVIGHYPCLQDLVEPLERLLRSESNRSRNAHSFTFLQGLGLLARLDAMFRSPMVDPPSWFTPGTIRSRKDLLRALDENYPDEFVRELKELVTATREDLPNARNAMYNPVFGGAVGDLLLAGDGDLILDDLLVELKVSVEPIKGSHFWQLLTYAAFDREKGRKRIKRVAVYNPRYRVLWSDSLDSTACHLGGESFDEFVRWLRTNGEVLAASAWDYFLSRL